MLTYNLTTDNLALPLTHSTVGTTTSVKHNIKGVMTPFRTGVFLCLPYFQFMASRMWSHFGGRVSFETRGSNSVYRLAALNTTQLGKSPINSKEIIMPKSNVSHIRPNNNVLPFKVPEPRAGSESVTIGETIVRLPEFIETSISYILEDFDYENNQNSDTATALRILAVTANRLRDRMGLKREGEHDGTE